MKIFFYNNDCNKFILKPKFNFKYYLEFYPLFDYVWFNT